MGIRFPQLHGTNMYRRVVSLGLENLTKFVPRFPRSSGPKHFFLHGFTFPQPDFSKTCWGYVSLSFMVPTCTEESFHSALRTYPSLCLPSLGLLDPNNFLHGFTFPQPGFSKTCWGYVSLSFTAPTCREESFHLALRT